jgi:dihydrofolate synthase / folylpolyglutamate synthase
MKGSNVPDMTLASQADSPPTALSYEEAMRFWYSHVNYEQHVPRPADLKLELMKAFLERLGAPQRRLRIVHVAGSKGKGSTSAMLAAVLRASGYHTGLFTSPHLCRVEERIQVDGKHISPTELAALMTDVVAVSEQYRHQGEASLTFFEIASALGFLHFARRNVDVAVVEVGLGGRFDSTNVCLPEVAVITSISFDHTQQLGNRLGSIAGEKAGIIKEGRPVVSGVLDAEPRSVIEDAAHRRQSPLFQLGKDFSFRYEPGRVQLASKPRVQVFAGNHSSQTMELGLLGEHQAANASLVVATVEQLRRLGWLIPEQAVVQGLAEVYWPARLEVVARSPWVILDCAHNVASVLALVSTLNESFPPVSRRLIFASSRDKDVAEMFRTLGPHFRHAYLTQFANNPRSFTAEGLAEMWRACTEVSCSHYKSAPEALKEAMARSAPNELVCVSGSVFLAGELRPLLVEDGH